MLRPLLVSALIITLSGPALAQQVGAYLRDGSVLYGKVIKDDPADKAAQNCLNGQMDQCDIALQSYTATLKSAPPLEIRSQYYLNRAKVYWALSQNDLALADYDAALRDARTSEIRLDTYLSRAHFYINSDQIDLGLADYDSVLKIDSNSHEANSMLCWYLGQRDQVQEALGRCDKAIMLDAKDADLLLSRGALHYTLGEYSKAEEDFDAALQVNVKDARALFGRGASKLKMRDSSAGNDIETAGTLDPQVHNDMASFGIRLSGAELLTALAYRGDVKAEETLGEIYLQGKFGVQADPTEAFKWNALAAKHGNSTAQSNLGVQFAHGDGTTRDFMLAYVWYSMSADQNDKAGVSNLGGVTPLLNPEQLERAKELAAKCKASNYQDCM